MNETKLYLWRHIQVPSIFVPLVSVQHPKLQKGSKSQGYTDVGDGLSGYHKNLGKNLLKLILKIFAK